MGKNRSFFTLVEMLVVIAIIAILCALLAPSLHNALDNSRLVSCNNNLRQIGVMFHSYGSDYRGHLPVLFQAEGKKGWVIGDHGNWDSYRAGWYGGEGSTLEWLFIGYGDYDSFDPGRVSGSKVWTCPAGTLGYVWRNENEGGSMEAGYQYMSAGPATNSIEGGSLNSYQMATHALYTRHDGLPPAVFDPATKGKMRFSYFTSANQPLQYCSARVEMDVYNGYRQGRSNHEHIREGFSAPRPLLYFDGSVRSLHYFAWTSHYLSGLATDEQLHRGPYSGGGLWEENNVYTDFGLLPNNYPAGKHKQFHYQVFDP